jgi:hypothetical protein
MTVSGNGNTSPDSMNVERKTSALCWSARVVTLVGALLIGFPWSIYGIGLTLLVAIIAWRWHLPGGILIILPTVAWLIYVLVAYMFFNERPVSEYEFWDIYPFLLALAAPFLSGGVLHLIVWWKEERKKQIPPQTWHHHPSDTL